MATDPLRTIQRRVQRVAERAPELSAKAAAPVVRKAAKGNVAVLTGALKASLQTQVEPGIVMITSDLPYALKHADEVAEGVESGETQVRVDAAIGDRLQRYLEGGR